jgi:hypothetical protein
LWYLDSYIPLKNKFVIEMVRGAVLWNVWLERNRLCFTNHKPRTVSMVAMQIVSMAHHWCKKKGKIDLLHLSLVLPQEIADLSMQVQPLLEGEEMRVEGGQAEVTLEEDSPPLDRVLVVSPIPLTCGRETDFHG